VLAFDRAGLRVPSSHLLIRGARVYDREGDIHKPPIRDVIVSDDRIASVSSPDIPTQAVEALIEAASKGRPDVIVLDGRGKLLIPGLVNAHYHSYDVLSKGRFEDMPFDVWALHAQPGYWGARSRQELRVRTLLGAVECLQHGITTIQDMNTLVPQDEATLDTILAAYAEVGIRVVFSIAARDLPQLDIAPFLPDDMPAHVRSLVSGAPGNAQEQLAFIEAQIARLSPLPTRLRWAIGPSGPQRCSAELLEGLGILSQRYELPILTHVYETRAQLARARSGYAADGGSLVNLMAATGLLTERTTLAHGVYLTAEEIEQIAAAGSGVVHNPVSNLKLKNGVAPLLELRRAGVNIALGCDNCSCSDCQNLFQAMKFFILLAAGMDGQPAGLLAADALDAATIGGARAVGLAGEIGEIREGMKADLVLIDLGDVAYLPLNSAARQLVYSESGRGVDTVIVDGHIVVDRGRPKSVDMAILTEDLAEVMGVANRDYEALVERQAPAIPHLLRANASLLETDLGLQRFIHRRPGE
jgi:5-methylthioadenosine/S-adenosylhomocysteine deaminase